MCRKVNGVGDLVFISAPDYEALTDSNNDGISDPFEVTLRAQDPDNMVLFDEQTVAVIVADVNEAPEITSTNSFSIIENILEITTVTASDIDGDTLAFSIAGGADGDRFEINENGVLSFKNYPNFEAPADDNSDSLYEVEIAVSNDGSPELNTTQRVIIEVTDTDEFSLTANSDVISGGPADENITATASTLTSGDDLDGGDGTDTLALLGGGDFRLDTVQRFANFEKITLSNPTLQNAVLRVDEGSGLDIEVSSTYASIILGGDAGANSIIRNSDSNGTDFIELKNSASADLIEINNTGLGVAIVQFGNSSTFDDAMTVTANSSSSDDQVQFSGSTFDITGLSHSGFEALNAFGTTTVLVDTDNLA